MVDTVASPAILERARQLVEPSLRDAVGRLDASLRLPANYHFGWATASGLPVDEGSGKGIRPALAVLGAEAVGSAPAVAVSVGVAVELVHNFSLIHDDIIDGDVERRHRPTVWSQFTTGDAIICGDAMHALAFQVLLEPGGQHCAAVARRLGDATSAMIRGQSGDMSFATRSDVSIDDCLEMEANKTGALLAFAITGSALLGGADSTVIEALHVFGIELGVAFQARDDDLGVWGEPTITGKAAGNDLRERKRSMPIVLALTKGGSDATRLLELFAKPEVDDAAVAEGIEILDRSGARQGTREIATERLGNAVAALDGASIEPTARAELIELARFVVERDH